MNTRSTHFGNVFVMLAIACWFAACSSTPSIPTTDTNALERRALAALDAGDSRTAADLFAQLANVTNGAQRAGYLLEAASLEIELSNLLSARELLTRAQASLAPGEQTERSELLTARLELAERRPNDALVRARSLLTSANTGIRTGALEVAGLAQFALNQPVEAIRNLSEREVWLDDIDVIRANQQTLWLNLFAVPSNLPPTGDEIVDGWLALAPIARITSEQERKSALLQWRSAWLRHPAARILLTDLLGSDAERPRQIALLLPLSSAAREEARAIRDGFLAAHMLASNETGFGGTDTANVLASNELTVRVYDTGTIGAEQAYLQAQIDGADFVVGPLFRNSVQAVLLQSGLIPTLLLNHTLTDEEIFANTYQFALAPEDEAVAVARRAIALGQRRAVVLLPSNDRGYRIFNSFQNEYEALGGEVLEFMGYDGVIGTYGERISMLLNLDRSNARERTLQANLREDLEFAPRRRQDIDMVFLIGSAADGRQLAPQLEFLYAGDIPTYAISEIHDLNARGRDADLNRIIFPQVPWLIAPDMDALRLQQTIEARWPERSAPMARFFGMGVDSYRIVNTLYRDPFFTSVAGSTGLLRMDPQGRIHRDLPFAQFRGGSVQPLEDIVSPQLIPESEIAVPPTDVPEGGIRTDRFGPRPTPGG
jgi:outer membrane PBP1 activator LpoA protein